MVLVSNRWHPDLSDANLTPAYSLSVSKHYLGKILGGGIFLVVHRTGFKLGGMFFYNRTRTANTKGIAK